MMATWARRPAAANGMRQAMRKKRTQQQLNMFAQSAMQTEQRQKTGEVGRKSMFKQNRATMQSKFRCLQGKRGE